MAEGATPWQTISPYRAWIFAHQGPEGNIEYLMYVQHCDTPLPLPEGLIEKVVAASHETLDKAPICTEKGI